MKFINKIIFALVLVTSFLLLYFVGFSYKNLNFNSDSAVKVLLAKEIFDTGTFFPKDWVYMNNDIFVFFGHVYIIPLLYFIPAGYSAHAVSGLISIGLIFIALNLIISFINSTNIQRLLINLVLLSGISLPVTEHMYGQVSYGFTFYTICFILWSSWRIVNMQQHVFFCSLLLFILNALVYWSNPQRAIIFICSPLIISIILYNIKIKYSLKNFKNKNFKLFYILISLSSLIGLTLNYLTLKNVNTDIGYSSLSFLSISEIIERLGKLLGGIIFLLGGEPLGGRKLVSLVGLYEAFRVFTTFMLIGILPTLISRVIKYGNEAARFILYFSLISFCLISFFLLATNIYDERYLIPSIILILVVVFIDESLQFKKNINLFIFKSLAIVGLVSNTLVINNAVYWNNFNQLTAQRVNYPLYGSINELIEFLILHKLKYGYASYWRSGLITVLSDERVKVRSIGINNGEPIPSYGLGSKNWFTSDYYQGEIFLLLTPEEDRNMDWIKMSNDGFKPERELQFKSYKIYTFNKNFSDKLLNW